MSKEKIEKRIEKLKTNVDKQRKLIIDINKEIENENFLPNKYQQSLIDHICNQGKQSLKEIKRLEKLKNKTK